MRIAIDGRFYPAVKGGISRYTRELVRNLLTIDGENEYFLFLTPDGASECDLHFPNLKKIMVEIDYYTLAEQLKLGGELAKVKPDVTHFLNFNHPLFYSKPYITTVHDLTMNFYPVGRSQKSLIRRQAYLKLMHHACTDPEAVIVPTATVKKDLVEHLRADAAKIHVIYEGATEPSGAVAKPKKEYLAKLGITGPYLLFVSQWRPHKGLGVLVEAFNEIKKARPDLQLVISGKASDQFPEISAAVEASPFRKDIVTPGFVDDELLDALYVGAELFVFPSWYEGFGLPPLEAMARGAAVASSNTSVMPEVLGEAAVYFDPHSPADVARVITETLNDPGLLKSLRAKSLQQAAKYSWRKMAEETLALYTEVYEKNRPRR